jgi:hypothetical protein
MLFALSEGTFQRARILHENKRCEKTPDDLRLLRELAPQIHGGFGLLERARADASHFMEKQNPDYHAAAQAIAELAWLFEHAAVRPPIALFCLLGRLRHWCSLTRTCFDVQDLSESLAEIAQSTGDYAVSWLHEFERNYQDPAQWERAITPACFLVRTSGSYLEPRLDPYSRYQL